MKLLLLLTLFCGYLNALYAQCPTGNVLYVQEGATPGGDGTSWGQAFTDLQDALSLAAICTNITEIWVAAGTYRPTSETDRDVSFLLRNNLAIYGGFAGNETELVQRNLTSNSTLLSGDIGTPGDASDNSYSVVRAQNVNNSARLDGFIIENGNANEIDLTNPQSNGGGIYISTASPSLANLLLRQNQAGNDGAGIFALFSNTTMYNIVFDSNTAGRLGGGIYSVTASNNTCLHCTFSSNTAVIGGGATGTVGSTTTLVNNIIWGNSSGIYNNVGGVTNVSNSIVQDSYPGVGNLNLDPLFVEAPNGNLEVQSCSPAINTGVFEIDSDVLGRQRNVNGGVDMGAYEFQDDPTPVIASCQGQTVFLNEAGEVDLDLSELDNGSTGCGMLTFSVEDEEIITFNCDDVGSNSLILTVSDIRGVFAICTTSVTVEDTLSPSVQCFNQTLTLNGESTIALDANDLVDADDNCGIQSIILNPMSISCEYIGQLIPVTITVTDVNNNTASCTSNITVEGLPCGWSQDQDGINCSGGSSVSFNPSNQEWSVTSTNCFYSAPFNSDASAFAQQTLCGNGSITAQVTGISGTALGWAGVVMREDNSGGAKKAQLMTNLSNFSRREFRTMTNGAAHPQQFPSMNRYWLRITRSGNQFSMEVSPNGMNWFLIGAQNIVMPSCIQAGLVVTNYNSNSTVTGAFANVSVQSANSMQAPEQLVNQGYSENVQEASHKEGFSLYPNPANSEVWLNLVHYLGQDIRIELLDIQGRLVKADVVTQVSDGTHLLPLINFSPGMYMIKVTGNDLIPELKRLIIGLH